MAGKALLTTDVIYGLALLWAGLVVAVRRQRKGLPVGRWGVALVSVALVWLWLWSTPLMTRMIGLGLGVGVGVG